MVAWSRGGGTGRQQSWPTRGASDQSVNPSIHPWRRRVGVGVLQCVAMQRNKQPDSRLHEPIKYGFFNATPTTRFPAFFFISLSSALFKTGRRGAQQQRQRQRQPLHSALHCGELAVSLAVRSRSSTTALRTHTRCSPPLPPLGLA